MSCTQSRSLHTRLKAGAVTDRGDTKLWKKYLCWEWESWQSAWLPHIVWYSGWLVIQQDESLISYCISAQECGFSISICLPNSVTIFSVCLKGSLIWLISLHSELNFCHSQKSYFLLDCKCLFCFAVQSCIAVSLKNYFFCVKFQTNSWVISLVLKLETNKIWMYLIFCQALVCFYSNYCIQP